MTEYKNIKFKFKLPYIVKLKYDEPKKGKGTYGEYFIYGVEYEGEECSFFASEGLNAQLLKYGEGDILEIIKIDDGDKKSHFEVEQLSADDIKSTVLTSEQLKESTYTKYEQPDWDRINADKQHSIVFQVASKLAIWSFPLKAKFEDADYEEIEVRTVKFNAMMEKYLVVKMKEPVKESQINIFVQKKAEIFKTFLKDNKSELPKDIYDTSKKWIDGLDLEKTDVKQLTINLDKIKKHLKSESKYDRYHDDLITECEKLMDEPDRLAIIQTLDNFVKAWKIEGLKELSETTENQCLNLLGEFEQQLKDDDKQDVPY